MAAVGGILNEDNDQIHGTCADSVGFPNNVIVEQLSVRDSQETHHLRGIEMKMY